MEIRHTNAAYSIACTTRTNFLVKKFLRKGGGEPCAGELLAGYADAAGIANVAAGQTAADAGAEETAAGAAIKLSAIPPAAIIHETSLPATGQTSRTLCLNPADAATTNP